MLLEGRGIKVDEMDSAGVSPLWEAISSGQQDTAGNILLSKGANIGAFDRRGSSLLHNAIAENFVDGAIYLLQKGAPILDIDVDHHSCLTLAITHNKPTLMPSAFASTRPAKKRIFSGP